MGILIRAWAVPRFLLNQKGLFFIGVEIINYKFWRGGLELMNKNMENTMKFNVEKEEENEARNILLKIYEALEEKGYNPINQIVGYLLSGDPAYITSHKNARSLVRKLERDEFLEELVRYYIKSK
jgi:uncharacterized protein (UPF0297 family)